MGPRTSRALELVVRASAVGVVLGLVAALVTIARSPDLVAAPGKALRFAGPVVCVYVGLAWGAAALLYTDVARDGTGGGPAVEATAALAAAAAIPVIASGGIGSLDHLRQLAAAGIPMAVVGRALYDKKFTLAEAIAAAC